MSRLRPSVDEQLAEFETILQNLLKNQLYEGINFEFWEEMDDLDVDSKRGIFLAFELGFAHIMERYRFAPAVLTALKAAKVLMRSCVDVAMNNFYPHRYGPINYIDRVIRNTMEIYYQSIYVHLRIEIIMSNHSAHVIQRGFRRFFTDPSYTMCIRRLNREFERDHEQLRALTA
jgi:hypothetical protein